jgi:hypothetical protein
MVNYHFSALLPFVTRQATEKGLLPYKCHWYRRSLENHLGNVSYEELTSYPFTMLPVAPEYDHIIIVCSFEDRPNGVADIHDRVELPVSFGCDLVCSLECRLGTFGSCLVKVLFKCETHRPTHHHRRTTNRMEYGNIGFRVVVEGICESPSRHLGVIHWNENP